LAHVPLSPAAKQLAGAHPELPAQLATAGDDYELLFTAAPEANEHIRNLSKELGLPITTIGTIEEGAGVRLLDANGKDIPLADTGYRHF
jgi:thiamine-monophosphate kinase